MSRYVVKTLGCKANFYDTQLLEQELQKKGWLPLERATTEELRSDQSPPNSLSSPSSDVQLCIVNSCTVTNEADKQSKKMASRLAKENPNAVIVMTGCGAEVDPDGMLKSAGIHYVVGNQNKNKLVDWVLEKIESHQEAVPEKLGTVSQYKELLSKHPHDREWPPATDSFFLPGLVGSEESSSGLSHKTRCFLKIQEGCNSFCTYCIIPYGRGPSRSLPIIAVVSQIQKLVDSGVKEVVLTGTNIGDYGSDLGLGFALGPLIRAILKETELLRLRVSSLDPTEITSEILELMESNQRFCPHFHVSLQSPHSRILRLMKRKYGFEQVRDCLTQIAQLKSSMGTPFVGMDLITGFPGETEDDFKWTYDALAELPWSRLHVFPYSERKGTPATRLPGTVYPHIRSERARILNELSFGRLKSKYQGILDSFQKRQDQSQRPRLEAVLIEKANPQGWSAGFTPDYLRVLLPQSSLTHQNELVSVEPLEISLDPKSWDVSFVGNLVSSQ